MIYVIFDPEGIAKKDGDLLFDCEKYVTSYNNALENLSIGKDLRIIVNKSVYVQWFKNLASRYPQGTFIFETIDARSVLAQRWEVDLPIIVTNEDILQAGLLSSDLRPQPGFTFEDTLLASYYNPILTSKTFPFTKL